MNYIKKELDIDSIKASAIADFIGMDYYKVKQEVEKIKNYFEGEEIDLKKIEKIKKELMSKTQTEYKFYNLIDLLYENKYRELIEYLEKTNGYMLFLSMIVKDMQLLSKLKYVEEDQNFNFSRMSYNEFKNINKIITDILKIK